MVAVAKNLSNRGQLFSLLFYVGHELAFEVGVFVFGLVVITLYVLKWCIIGL